MTEVCLHKIIATNASCRAQPRIGGCFSGHSGSSPQNDHGLHLCQREREMVNKLCVTLFFFISIGRYAKFKRLCVLSFHPICTIHRQFKSPFHSADTPSNTCINEWKQSAPVLYHWKISGPLTANTTIIFQLLMIFPCTHYIKERRERQGGLMWNVWSGWAVSEENKQQIYHIMIAVRHVLVYEERVHQTDLQQTWPRVSSASTVFFLFFVSCFLAV